MNRQLTTTIVRALPVFLFIAGFASQGHSQPAPLNKDALPVQARWLFEAHGCLPHSSPLDGNELYLGTCTRLFHKINLSNGEGIWTYHVPDSVPTEIEGNSVVSDSLVFFGTSAGWDNPRAGAMYALRRSNADLIWRSDFGAGISSDFAQSPSLIFAITLDDRLLAVEKSSGKLKWSKSSSWIFYKTPRTPSLSSPLVIDSVVYFPARDSTMYALRVKDGSLVWKHKFGNELLMRIAQVGNNILTGGIDSVLTLVNRKSGAVTASRKLNMRPVKLPIVSDSLIFLYLGDKSNEPRYVAAYPRDLGPERWRAMTTDQKGSPYFCSNRLTRINGAVLAGTYVGNVLAFDERDGEFLWDLTAGSTITLVQAVDSMVLIGNLMGQVTLQKPRRGLRTN